MLRRLAATALAAMLAATPALAQPTSPADILRESMYGGTLAKGLGALQPMADQGDREAQFGVGMLTFFSGVEQLLQSLYRHGLAAPRTGPMGPVLGVPMPENTTPEPLDYQKFRAILQALVDDLDAANEALLEAGTDGDYVVKLDPLKFRVDVNGDGTSDETESVAGVIGRIFGEDPRTMSDGPGMADSKDNAKPSDDSGIGFDRADAIWMGGYSIIIAAQAEFFLAHDFSDTFNVLFHRLFPRAGLPMQEATGGMVMMDPETDTAIADLVAAIHTINWPVIDQERLRRQAGRLESVIMLSRANWEAILAETDDNAELLPSPTQTPIEGPPITTEMVAAWHDTLAKADQIIKGQLLIPHWRFKQGFDLRAYFETATRTDLVMILTGFGALPYLKDGPIVDGETFAEADRIFGGNLLGYAFWFN